MTDYGETDGLQEATPEQIERYFLHSAEDAALYAALRAPYFPDPHPTVGHLGAHSIRAVRAVCEIARPKRILEIGYCMGHSAEMWMHFAPDARLVSVDPGGDPIIVRAVEVCRRLHPYPQFDFIKEDSRFLLKNFGDRIRDLAPDLVYIDGMHTHEFVDSDIKMARELGARWICLDDYWRVWGPGVKDAMWDNGLAPFAQWGNIVLCGTM